MVTWAGTAGLQAALLIVSGLWLAGILPISTVDALGPIFFLIVGASLLGGAGSIVSIAFLQPRHSDLYAMALSLWLAATTVDRALWLTEPANGYYPALAFGMLAEALLTATLIVALRRGVPVI